MRIEQSDRSRTAAATLPKNKFDPVRGLTPITIKLCFPIPTCRKIASSAAACWRAAVRTETPNWFPEPHDIFQGAASHAPGADRPGRAETTLPGRPLLGSGRHVQRQDRAAPRPCQRQCHFGAAPRKAGSRHRSQNFQLRPDRVLPMRSARRGDGEGAVEPRREARNSVGELAVGGGGRLGPDDQEVVALARLPAIVSSNGASAQPCRDIGRRGRRFGAAPVVAASAAALTTDSILTVCEVDRSRLPALAAPTCRTVIGRRRDPANRPTRRDAKRPLALSSTATSSRSMLVTKPSRLEGLALQPRSPRPGRSGNGAAPSAASAASPWSSRPPSPRSS